MRVQMITKWSPKRGQMLQAGQQVDVPDEIGLDMIQRGIAIALRATVEHAVAPGQERAA